MRGRFVPLAGKLIEGGATVGKRRFLGEHAGEAVANGEREPAAFADEAILFEQEMRVTGVEGATEELLEVGADHEVSFFLSFFLSFNPCFRGLVPSTLAAL
jgi:hypothetical protein